LNCKIIIIYDIYFDFYYKSIFLLRFEKLFDRKNKTVKDKRYFRELCLPMFCHLYLNLISPQNHEQLKNFLKKFKHIFENTKGLDFLKELKKVKDVKKLSPRLQVFR